ncbi:MAG: methylated-DNA--[protein]-cysteine S-methyltransferase [Muribaculaceae bacterium]
MNGRFATVEVGEVGTLIVAADDRGVYLCDWLHGRHDLSLVRESVGGDSIVSEAVRQLHEYLAGQRREFTVALNPGGTAFQRTVWDALRCIPYSTTATYSQVAAAIGRSTAVRAVATAIAANPLSILITCHRVLPANGSVGNYAGHPAAKRYLLRLEAIHRRCEF